MNGGPYYAIGESLNRIFLPGSGFVWNGSSLENDPAVFPQRPEESLGTVVSNARSNTFFIAARYLTADSATYIYKRK